MQIIISNRSMYYRNTFALQFSYVSTAIMSTSIFHVKNIIYEKVITINLQICNFHTFINQIDMVLIGI